MITQERQVLVTQEEQGFYQRQGYLLVEGVFTPEEIGRYRDHFMEMRRSGGFPGDMVADTLLKSADPLKRYPRMINMHRWDDLSRDWMNDARLLGRIEGLF